jgi:hypothetical protein
MCLVLPRKTGCDNKVQSYLIVWNSMGLQKILRYPRIQDFRGKMLFKEKGTGTFKSL